jgi:hypothetical protein
MPINDRDYSPSLLDLTFGEGANGRLKELEPEHARSGARNGLRRHESGVGLCNVSAGSAVDHENFGLAHGGNAHAASGRNRRGSCEAWVMTRTVGQT